MFYYVLVSTARDISIINIRRMGVWGRDSLSFLKSDDPLDERIQFLERRAGERQEYQTLL